MFWVIECVAEKRFYLIVPDESFNSGFSLHDIKSVKDYYYRHCGDAEECHKWISTRPLSE